MKCLRLAAILVMALGVGSMAAQKKCDEVFPNAGVKTALGVDGSLCTVTTIKNGSDYLENKIMVSRDNSKFKYYLHVSKNGTSMTLSADCVDVGSGYKYECKGNKDGTEFTEMEDFMSLLKMFQFVSPQDKRYMFGGNPPWEEGL